MIYNNKYYFLLRDSKGIYYKFSLYNKILNIEEYDYKEKIKNTSLDDYIIDYSVDIDENNNIHILYVSLDGKIKYRLYNSQKEVIVSNINLKNYNINFLSLKILSSDIHIFYMLCSKINTKYWNVFHSYWTNNNWCIKKIGDIYSKKYVYPYIIDCHNDNLYFFYSPECNGKYKIKKFNLTFKVWTDLDNNINIRSQYNAAFFVNNEGIAIVCYNAIINDKLILLMRYRNLEGKNCSVNWSKDIVIGSELLSPIYPSIFCKKNLCYIMWKEKSNIVYRKCEELNKWEGKKVINTGTGSIGNFIYISNNKKDEYLKNNFMLLSMENITKEFIELNDSVDKNNNLNYEKFIPFNMESNSLKGIGTLKIGDSMNVISDTTNKVIESEIELKDNYINQLSKIINDKNRYLINIKNEIENLQSKIQQSSKCEDGLKAENGALKAENITLKEELKQLKNTHQSANEKNFIIEDLNTKINNLYSILETKENIISNLKSKLEILDEDNKEKDEKISSLEGKLNKGLWKIFKS